MVQTHPIIMAKIKLTDYVEIIKKYLPFVFIQCTKYTNNRRLTEFIAVYTFISVYRLSGLFDGYSIERLIEIMVDLVGEDLGKGSISDKDKLLFKLEDDLIFARRLSCLKIEECLDIAQKHKDFITRNFDLPQFSRTTDSVMDYLRNNTKTKTRPACPRRRTKLFSHILTK